MVRVAVSVDDEIVISAFRDRNATTQWNRSNHSYFASKYSNLEIRDELKPESTDGRREDSGRG